MGAQKRVLRLGFQLLACPYSQNQDQFAEPNL